MSFASPLYLALVILVVPMLWLRRKRQTAVGHSQVNLHKNLRSVPIIGWLPTLLFILAWTALCVALARPLLPEVSQKKVIQTRDFIICTDISGSMWSVVQDQDQVNYAGGQPSASNPAPGSGTGDGDSSQPQQLRRIDIAQLAIQDFVSHRQGDRVALFVFDDQTYYHWPLTDDLKIIQRKAKLLNLRQGGGTNFEGPDQSNPGVGPLQAAIDHFKAFGKAKTKVLIMVTDGEDSIDPARADVLAQQMQQMGIHVYVLGVGESWTSGQDLDLGKFADRMGGTVIRVGNKADMQAGFAKIDQMEKSAVVLETSVSYKDIYQYFLGLSLILWLLYLGSTALIRENA